MNIEIKDKVSVIIGGTSGIGKATVKLFLQAGSVVIFTGRNIEKGRTFEKGLKSNFKSDKLVFIASDISKEDDIKRLANYVKEEWAGCDILFNNAGILRGAKIHETSTVDWQTVIDVNLTGYFYTSKYFIPQMIEKNGGVIINTSSISGLYGDYNCCAYNAAKGGVSNMTRAMALDYAKYNIRINAICPGSIRTPMYDSCSKTIGKQKCEKIFQNTYPGHRIGEPEEVAKVVLFLASDWASFVNGVNLPIDGGLTAHSGQPKFIE